MRSSLARREPAVYRSNSSLDLMYADAGAAGTLAGGAVAGAGLRREYGSHGSIDVIGGERSSPPAAVALPTPGGAPRTAASPKPRLRGLQRLWGGAVTAGGRGAPEEAESCSPLEPEEARRRIFAHHDCRSLAADLGCAARLRGMLLSRRRNTTTGASAASLLQARASGSDPGTADQLGDAGDGRSNDLIESCSFFRNEIGGEEERSISLSWRTCRVKRAERVPPGGGGGGGSRHRPVAAYGLSVLEFPPGQSHWGQPGCPGCPFARPAQGLMPVESQDLGAHYYRKYFYGQDHQNWFGMDENLGPVAVSIKKERVELPVTSAEKALLPNSNLVWQYRLIIRTSELLTLRGSVLEDAVPCMKPSNNSKSYNTKDVFEYILPEVQLPSLRLGISGNGAEEQLLRLDEQCVTRHYKVGVMYCRKGQATEEEMYNNKEAGSAFIEFLQSLGQTVLLKGFDKYKAGLDNKSDSTGTYSVYTTYQDCEIMFHVSTMLPYTPNNRQQLLRKRHIGNDIVTIVFQEPGAQPFTPKNIRSQFQHVFIVVRAVNPCTENTHYSIAVSRSKEVPIFGPPIKEGAMYPKGEVFTDLLLSKVINGENAAIQSPKFSTMATRTRQEYLKDLAKNYISATPLDTGQKFSIFSSLLMKGGANAASAVPLPRGPPAEHCWGEALVGGALSWLVTVQDEGSGGVGVECFLGISPDTVVVVEEITRQIVLVIPTKFLLGWVVSGGGWTRLYYHRGECVCVRGGGDALLRRLAAVAPPGAVQLSETILERNASGQLGFHVQPDGLVTAVESGGTAARAGVRRGVRLLEVCRAAVVMLHHDQLVDLLKTSEPVTVTLTAAAGPRCECWPGGAEEDTMGPPARGNAQLPGRQRRTYDRSFSPPRSSDSSGYGTGGSGRSARRSPELSPEVVVEAAGAGAGRRSSHDEPAASSPRRTTPRRASVRPHSGAGSLQEELMRLIDPESIGAPHVATTARPAAVVSPASPPHPSHPSHPSQPPLPLPDAATLDWPALVHTATRAMLQICEEHQYPSMDCAESTLSGNDGNLSENNALDSWHDLQLPSPPPPPAGASSASGAACECGLGARVAALEEEARRLRRHNARLREESARAVRQLRRFTQWFMHTVDRQ